MVDLSDNEIKLCFEEHSEVREELRHLKDCQVKYFTFSITATALILSILSRFGSFAQIQAADAGIVFLFPLIVLIPAWLVFFDKAKTITRGVAYYRFIEKRIIGTEDFHLLGWENALNSFRENEKERNLSELKTVFSSEYVNKLLKSLENFVKSEKSIKSVGNYWMIINFTFFGLSLVCIILSLIILGITRTDYFPNSYSRGALLLAIIITISVTIYNLRNYINLVSGKYSYQYNYNQWKLLLYPKSPKMPFISRYDISIDKYQLELPNFKMQF